MLTTNGTDNSKAFSMQLLTRRLPLPSFFKGINQQLVMHLQYELDSSFLLASSLYTFTMAILIISAAVPCMGVFRAILSPKDLI